MKRFITYKQFNALQLFFNHCRCVHHHGISPRYANFKQQLDDLNIHFYEQNITSELSEHFENITALLEILLNDKDIFIKG